MVNRKQALCAHYRNPGGGFPRDVFVAKAGAGLGSQHNPLARHLAAQVYIMREDRGVGEQLSLDDIVHRLEHEPSITYVANLTEDLRLNDCLGFATVSVERGSGTIRAHELAVREHRMAHTPPAHLPIIAGILRPALEDLIDRPADLEALDLAVVSPYPSSIGTETMQQLGLRRIEAGFKGEAQVVYERIGALGLAEIPLNQ